MRNNHRKALRLIASALVSSDLSASDIRQLAEDLDNYDFRDTMRNMLLNVSRTVDYNEFSQEQDEPNYTNQFKRLQDAVKRRKISRKYIIDMISLMSDSREELEKISNLSIAKILEHFVKNRPNDVDQLLSLFGEDDVDPYLKGIMNRGQR